MSFGFRLRCKWVAMHSGDGWRLSSLKVMRNGILSKDRQVSLEKSIIWAGEVMHGVRVRLKYMTDVTGSP